MTPPPLFPYQNEGVRFLVKTPFACLWDDPGLGKTPQVLVAAELLACKRVLVVCPALARRNWQREAHIWSAYKPTVLETTKDYPVSDFVICSFEYARKRADWLSERPWDLVVVDEVHMCSNMGAARTQAILGVNGPVHKAESCWVLSGTPIRNHAGELWPIFTTFGLTDLSQEQWEDAYCRVEMFQGRRRVVGTKASALDTLRDLVQTSKICLRRRKREVLKQLPPVRHSEILVDPAKHLDLMSFRSLTKYADTLPELKAMIALGMQELKHLLASLGRDVDALLAALSALSSGVAVVRALTGVRKIAGTVELINAELSAGHYMKLVVFAHHRDVIEGITQGVNAQGENRAVSIWGGQDPGVRDSIVQAFQHEEKPQVLVCQMDAAGVALNMTAAANCLIVEPPYVPATAQQCVDRLNRIGQTSPVLCRWVILHDDFFDRTVMGVMNRKLKVINAILNPEEATKEKQQAP